MKKQLIIFILLFIFAIIFCGVASATNVNSASNTISNNVNNIYTAGKLNITAEKYNQNNLNVNNKQITTNTKTSSLTLKKTQKTSKNNKLPDPSVIRGGTVIYSTTSIQDAVNHAINGDTIQIDEGTYTENVYINYNLTIVATGQASNTIVNAANPSLPIFQINSGGTGTTIQGLTINGSINSDGVLINGASNVKLTNLTMVNCQRGVEIDGVSSNVTIMSVNISSPVTHGVYFYGTISNLTVSGTDSNPTLISNSGSIGIYNQPYGTINGLNIDHTLISNSLSDAISLYSIYAMNNVNIWNTTVIGARGNGINVNMAASPLSGNITLLNNTVSDCMGNGFYLNTRGNTSIMGNTITGNGNGGEDNQRFGLMVTGYDTDLSTVVMSNNNISGNRNGLYLNRIQNLTLPDNNAIKNNKGFIFNLQNTNNITLADETFNSPDINTVVFVTNGNGLLIRNLTMVNCQRGVEIDGVSSNVTIMSVNISSPVTHGVYFYGTISNLTVSGTDSNPTLISNSGSIGIYNQPYGTINGLNIDHTLISNSLSDAISLYSIYAMNNVNIWNTTVIGARGNGINVNMAASPLSGNITLLNNTVSDCMGNGFYLNTRGNTSIMGNTITGNGNGGEDNQCFGLMVTGYDTDLSTVVMSNNNISGNRNGLYLNRIQNLTLPDNNAIKNNKGFIFNLQYCNNITLADETFNSPDINTVVFVTNGNGLLIRNLTMVNCQRGVEIDGVSSNVTIMSVNISSPVTHGVYLYGTISNLTVSGTDSNPTLISNSGSIGIYNQPYGTINGLNIDHTLISNSLSDAISLYSIYAMNNVNIWNTTVIGARGNGINVNMAASPLSGNITLLNNTVSDCMGNGFYLNTRGNTSIMGNTITGNGNGGEDNQRFGLMVTGYDTDLSTVVMSNNNISGNRNGLYLNRIQNLTLPDNNAIKNNKGFIFNLQYCNNITLADETFNSPDINTVVFVTNGNGLLIRNLTMVNCQRGVEIGGVSSNVTIMSVNISSPVTHGVYFYGTISNLTVSGTDSNPTVITNSGSYAIYNHAYSSINGLDIDHTLISNSRIDAIYLYAIYAMNNVNIWNTTVIGARGNGINVNMADNPLSGNITLLNNTVSDCMGNGFYLNTRGNTSIMGNTITGNGNGGEDNQRFGLMVTGYDTDLSTVVMSNNNISGNRNGLYLNRIQNLTLPDNNAIKNNKGFIFNLQNTNNITLADETFNSPDINTVVFVTNGNGLLIRNLTMVNCQRGVEIGGVSSNVTIMSVNISSPVTHGVYFYGTISNLTVSGTDSNPTVITNSGSYAIYNHAYSSINGLDIDHTLISNSRIDAIYLYAIYAMNNVNIWNTTVIGARGNGINVNMADNPLSGNITLLNNTVSDCMGNGFYLNTRGNTSIMGNTITGNGGYGVYLIGSNNPVVMCMNNTIGRNNNGLYLQSINNGVFQDNQLINNTGNDFYATTDTNNSFSRLTLGLLHPTIVSFDYVNGIIIKGVESTTVDSSKWYNIGKYINITGLGSTVCDLKVYYINSDLVHVEEATLKIFMYDGTAWNELSQSGVNTTEKYVYANDLNSFSTFAPLGTDTTPPTVNVDLTNGTYNTYKNVHLLASDNIDPQSVIYYMINEGIWNHQTTPVILNLNVDGSYNLEFYTTDFTGNQSPHQNRTYTIDTTSPTASSNIIGGLYNINQNIILTMTENGKIYYTTNGTVPTTSSTEYTNPITIATTTVLKFYAVDLASNPSPIYTETYTIDKIAPTVSANIIGGYYNTNKNVTLTMNKEGSIYYTLNGTIPTNQSNLYSDSTPLNINDTTILKFMAVDLAGNISPIYTENYTIDKIAPTASATLPSGLYNVNKVVTLNMSEIGTIYYTLNGTTPTTYSTIYTKPISITKTTVLRYLVVDLAKNLSKSYTQTYTLDKIAPKIKSTTPTNMKTKYNKTSAIVIKFTENIKANTAYKYITIKNLTTKKYIKITKTLKNNTLTIKTGTRNKNTWYTITIPKAAIQDNASNKLAATYTFKFKSI